MKKEVMKALFKQKPRTPVELVRHARELLIYAQSNTETREHKREEKLSDLSKTILEIRTVLYGHEGSEPSKDACANLTREFFKEDTFRLLIIALPNLNLGARQNATHVIANLQRQRVDEQLIASLYLENNMDLMDTLICGYEDNDIALTYGAIARECIRHQRVARYVLGSDLIKKFFGYVQIPNFDIQSDAAATFKELLTRHKSTVADFLDKNYDWFFQEYNSLLLESNCYLTKRIAVQLLGDMLLDRSNTAVMIRYVSSLDNMRIFMNLLRDSNKSIQFATFQVFKLFVANEHKPPEIVSIIISNRNKLLRFFADFNSDKEDELFQEDRQEVIRLIAALELKDTPATSLDKCEVPC